MSQTPPIQEPQDPKPRIGAGVAESDPRASMEALSLRIKQEQAERDALVPAPKAPNP